METISVGRKKWLVPESIDEMSSKQTVFVASLFREGLMILDFRMQAIAFLMGIEFRKFRRMFDNSDIFRLSELAVFLFEEVKGIPRFRLEYYTNPVQRIRVCWFRFLYGPGEMLQAVSMIEFRNADLAFQMYNENKEERYLDELCASLYRRKGVERFAEKEMDQLAKLFSHVALDVKFAFYLHFISVRNYLPTLYPYVFKKSSGKTSELFDWGDTIRRVGGGKFGTVDETAETKLHVFLKDLNETLEQKKNNS